MFILPIRLERKTCHSLVYKAISGLNSEIIVARIFLLQYYRKTVANYTAKWKAISITCYVIK